MSVRHGPRSMASGAIISGIFLGMIEGANSGLPKVILLAVAEAEGKGGKTSALEVEAEGEAEGLVFCI